MRATALFFRRPPPASAGGPRYYYCRCYCSGGNAHGSFIFGYGLLGMFVGCWVVTQFVKRFAMPASWAQIIAICCVTFLALILTLVFGPYGFSNFTHPFLVGQSDIFRQVAEWHPAWEFNLGSGLPVWPFWVGVIVVTVSLVTAGLAGGLARITQGAPLSAKDDLPRFTVFDVLLVLLGLYMAVRYRRFASLCFIVSSPRPGHVDRASGTRRDFEQACSLAKFTRHGGLARGGFPRLSGECPGPSRLGC